MYVASQSDKIDKGHNPHALNSSASDHQALAYSPTEFAQRHFTLDAVIEALNILLIYMHVFVEILFIPYDNKIHMEFNFMVLWLMN